MSEGSDWIIGFVTGSIGYVVSNLAVNLQKLSHQREELRSLNRRRAYFCQPWWILGISLLVVGTILTIVALSYAPTTITAPLASIGLLSNLIFVVVINKEKLTWRDIAGTLLIGIGTVGTTLAADKTATVIDLDYILNRFGSVIVILYICFLLCVSIVLYSILRIQLSKALRSREAYVVGRKLLQMREEDERQKNEMLQTLRKHYFIPNLDQFSMSLPASLSPNGSPRDGYPNGDTAAARKKRQFPFHSCPPLAHVTSPISTGDLSSPGTASSRRSDEIHSDGSPIRDIIRLPHVLNASTLHREHDAHSDSGASNSFSSCLPIVRQSALVMSQVSSTPSQSYDGSEIGGRYGGDNSMTTGMQVEEGKGEETKGEETKGDGKKVGGKPGELESPATKTKGLGKKDKKSKKQKSKKGGHAQHSSFEGTSASVAGSKGMSISSVISPLERDSGPPRRIEDGKKKVSGCSTLSEGSNLKQTMNISSVENIGSDNSIESASKNAGTTGKDDETEEEIENDELTQLRNHIPMKWFFLLRLIIPFIAGLFGGFSVLFSKCLGELLTFTFTYDENQFNHAVPWIIMVGAVFVTILQVHFQNIGLILFTATYFVPAFHVCWTVFSILMGAIFFQEFGGMVGWQIAMFILGFLSIICGVILISLKRMENDIQNRTDEIAQND
ncbi:Magnesium transporter NIPA like protein [Aduncisulcus paluster]|uniref:Magnesium transporter NIPA like protein n=1 Tax=Aduncisulcus paluster TaxID=2918883 RepID=A0ABQ5KYP9_9EUKA|nr:Magnesium transporter NIPA like protein [Aduncisulcus paluster]